MPGYGVAAVVVSKPCCSILRNKNRMADSSSQWFDAVHNRDYELIRDLIGHCACTRNIHGQTALMVAAIADDEKIVNLLLPHEAGQLDHRTVLH